MAKPSYLDSAVVAYLDSALPALVVEPPYDVISNDFIFDGGGDVYGGRSLIQTRLDLLDAIDSNHNDILDIEADIATLQSNISAVSGEVDSDGNVVSGDIADLNKKIRFNLFWSI